MDDTLEKISKLYCDAIPALLKNTLNTKAYAAFIPYFGWDCEPADHAEHASSVYVLTEEQLNAIRSAQTDEGQIGYHAYCWANFCSNEPTRLENSELTEHLLKWYEYQNENDETIGEDVLLEQIGKTMAATCLSLNQLDWTGPQFTDDFVIFTDCMAGEEYNHGLSSSVPPEWLAAKKKIGTFSEWLT